jgi:hypothetical protein
MNIFDCRDSWAPPIVREITFDWRDFEPLARAEASKFYWKQERGRFRFEDLYSAAAAALATSKGVNHAIKAINGALLDFARDDHKLVRNIEMTEEEFHRTRSALPQSSTRPAAVLRRVYISDGVRHALYTPGPYRTNAQLLAGDGKVSSKHDKVSVALGRATYKDGWNQAIGGQVRAKVESDKQQKADPKHHQQAPGSMALLLDSTEGKSPEDGVGQADYKGHGRKQRFSVSYFNAGKVEKPSSDYVSDGIASVSNPNRRAPVSAIRRIAAPPKLTWAELFPRRRTSVPPPPSEDRAPVLWSPEIGEWLLGGRRWSFHADEPESAPRKTFQRAPVASLASTVEGRLVLKQLAWVDRPDLAPVCWHREAGYFQIEWGLPNGIFHLEDHLDDGLWWRRGKLFSPEPEKSPDGGDVIYERGAPSRLAHGPAVFGGSSADRAAFLLPLADERLAHQPRCDLTRGSLSPYHPEPGVFTDAGHTHAPSAVATK